LPPVKQLIAIVKPYLAEKLVEALRRAPLEALTVREVKGYGRQKNYLEEYGQSEYALAFLPKVEIEAWVDDARVQEVVERITQFAHTGKMGDGKILILPVGDFQPISDLAPAAAARGH
jgi:nitrogen regulatory protein P-II 1